MAVERHPNSISLINIRKQVRRFVAKTAEPLSDKGFYFLYRKVAPYNKHGVHSVSIITFWKHVYLDVVRH